jgi:hypothetical protein
MGISSVGPTQLTSRLEHYSQIHRVYASRQPILTVTGVVRTQPGGSQSRLVMCSDGKLYVLKMHPNPQGPNVLANEALGSILLRGLGFLAPRWRPVTINLKTVRFFPELAMCTADGGITSPACGLHFGSEYLGGPQYHLFDFVPKSRANNLRSTSQLLPIYLFDVWAGQQDERQCIYQKTRETNLYDTFFIDNGHLFGGPKWLEVARRARATYSVHIKPPLVGDPRIEQWLKLFEDHIPRLLYHAVAAVPPEWYKDDIYSLYARLLWRLEFVRLLVAGDILRRDQERGIIDVRHTGRNAVALDETTPEELGG